MHHVKEEPDGSWFIVGNRVIHPPGHEAEVQGRTGLRARREQEQPERQHPSPQHRNGERRVHSPDDNPNKIIITTKLTITITDHISDNKAAGHEE